MIIPCAGYGTRMNMPIGQSKELLLDKAGNHLIEFYLNHCPHFNITPLVITRKEKTDLIAYCESNHIETLIIEPKGEWNDTVLASSLLWDEDNILVLPDTRFNSPRTAISDIKKGLELGNQAVIGLHKVDDVSKWGRYVILFL